MASEQINFKVPVIGVWIFGLSMDFQTQSNSNRDESKKLIWTILSEFIINKQLGQKYSFDPEKKSFLLILFSNEEQPQFYEAQSQEIDASQNRNFEWRMLRSENIINFSNENKVFKFNWNIKLMLNDLMKFDLKEKIKSRNKKPIEKQKICQKNEFFQDDGCDKFDSSESSLKQNQFNLSSICFSQKILNDSELEDFDLGNNSQSSKQQFVKESSLKYSKAKAKPQVNQQDHQEEQIHSKIIQQQAEQLTLMQQQIQQLSNQLLMQNSLNSSQFIQNQSTMYPPPPLPVPYQYNNGFLNQSCYMNQYQQFPYPPQPQPYMNMPNINQNCNLLASNQSINTNNNMMPTINQNLPQNINQQIPQNINQTITNPNQSISSSLHQNQIQNIIDNNQFNNQNINQVNMNQKTSSNISNANQSMNQNVNENMMIQISETQTNEPTTNQVHTQNNSREQDENNNNNISQIQQPIISNSNLKSQHKFIQNCSENNKQLNIINDCISNSSNKENNPHQQNYLYCQPQFEPTFQATGVNYEQYATSCQNENANQKIKQNKQIDENNNILQQQNVFKQSSNNSTCKSGKFPLAEVDQNQYQKEQPQIENNKPKSSYIFNPVIDQNEESLPNSTPAYRMRVDFMKENQQSSIKKEKIIEPKIVQQKAVEQKIERVKEGIPTVRFVEQDDDDDDGEEELRQLQMKYATMGIKKC